MDMQQFMCYSRSRIMTTRKAQYEIRDADATCLATLAQEQQPRTLSRADIIRQLLSPVWPDASGKNVFETVKPGQSVCLIVSDHTRKSGSDVILPVLLDEFKTRGCSLSDFFILIASGIHRPPTADELRKILSPSVHEEFQNRVFMHNADADQELVEVGRTKRGHPVRVNRRAIEADVLIPVGTASFHYHAGFGGGRKSLVPGIASRDTIAFNHSLTLDPEADRIHQGVIIGRLDNNPVAEEMLEAAYLCKPDIVICTVLSPSGELAGVFSGEMNLAHRKACSLVESLSGIHIKQKADFVIAATTARDWIQSHKALFNASLAVRGEGLIVLHAPCPEGLGNEGFRRWVKTPTVGEIFKNLRKHPEILGQTALSSRQRGARTILVTDMNATDSADLGIRTAPDMDTAVETVIMELTAVLRRKPTYYVMPAADRLVPICSM